MVKKTQLPQHILDAALDLAAERGWNRVTLADVALRARLPLPEVYGQFRSKAAILEAWMDQLDHAMIAGDVEEGVSTRDRLFDVVMRRLDAMNRHKQAVLAILRDGGGDPYAALCGARRMLRTFALMLEAAGISTSGLSGLARVEGMGWVYLYVLRAWLRDDTADLSHTMAVLDKALRRSEAVARMIWPGRGGPGPAPSPPPPAPAEA